MRQEKLMKLERVARLYYEQNLSQAEIASQMGISRPLISRLLAEARDEGMVEITIHSKLPVGMLTMEQAREVFGIQGGQLVETASDDGVTDSLLGDAAMTLISELGGGRLGLGWGHVIGIMASDLEKRPPARGAITSVCPLIGNSGVPIRHYHSNENTRIVAAQTKSTAFFLHTPAMAETSHELDLIFQTEYYQAIRREWQRLDVALVNIGNHPSTPDFASGARYGDLLMKHKAVGRLIAYYFNVTGEVIYSDQDYAIQIPLDDLQQCPRIIGICSANAGTKALIGALRTGLLTHVVAREELMVKALNFAQAELDE